MKHYTPCTCQAGTISYPVIINAYIIPLWNHQRGYFNSCLGYSIYCYIYHHIIVWLDPSDGDLTLVGVNGKDNEGIVEIYSSVKTYKWSPICSNEWDDADADVTCRQLGFKGGYSTHYR